ncbi:MAG: OmpA family protein, partial [Syntrophaceae bacterium]|nr:OmpA family protein [Syntrophaceae bacterium]
PIADNDTEEGRKKNRRVEAVIEKIVTTEQKQEVIIPSPLPPEAAVETEEKKEEIVVPSPLPPEAAVEAEEKKEEVVVPPPLPPEAAVEAEEKKEEVVVPPPLPPEAAVETEEKKEVVTPFPPSPPSVQEKISIALNIEFGTAKSVIKKKYRNNIKEVADFMQKNPDTKVIIEGHTDNVDRFNNPENNIKLSKARADSVRQYLIDKFGIDASRITAVGYGPASPIADNDTEEGRKKNRRVEAVIEKIVTIEQKQEVMAPPSPPSEAIEKTITK